jgi:HK97 gp10 family phage protein
MPRSTNSAVIITGLKAIDRRLKSLEPRLQRKVVRQSMRAGMKVLAQAVKAEAPVLTGATEHAVKVRVPKRKKRGEIALDVQIAADPALVKTGANGKSVFYPAVEQYGARNHPPNPFMTRSYDQAGETARNVTLQKLRDGIEREASKT